MTRNKSAVNISNLAVELKRNPNRIFCDYILNRFYDGFDTGLCELSDLSYECKNLLSARNQFETTTELLNLELERGYVIGPCNQIPYEHYRLSSLGVDEKEETNC